MSINEYLLISNQMQLLEREIAGADEALKPALYEAKAAFWPVYEKLMAPGE